MSVETARRQAREWIVAKGLAKPGEPTGAVMRRLAEYRAALPRMPRPGRLQWAHDIVACYQAGEYPHREPVRLAYAALGLTEVPVLRQPDPPPPRPDAKQRQSGDVMEPAF